MTVEEHQRWLLKALQGYADPGQTSPPLADGSEPGLSRSRIRKNAVGRQSIRHGADPTS